jgi:hypothetical protein
LVEVIREVQADMSAPLREGEIEWPPAPAPAPQPGKAKAKRKVH